MVGQKAVIYHFLNQPLHLGLVDFSNTGRDKFAGANLRMCLGHDPPGSVDEKD